jgi:hypothetical protein
MNKGESIMDEQEKLKANLLSCLKLNESEEILHINKYSEKKLLQIKDLAKYNDPDAFPEEIFPIVEKNYGVLQGGKKKYYEYHEFEVFTNNRVIFFGLT